MSLRLGVRCLVLPLLCGALFFSCLASGQASVVGWWAMDDDYPAGYFDPLTTADSSGNGNHATLLSTAEIGDGTGYIGNGSAVFPVGENPALDCGADPSIKPTGTGYSFATWVKFDDLDPIYQLIASDWNDKGTSGEKFFFHLAMNYEGLGLHLGQPGTNVYSLAATNPTPLTAGGWTHVGFTILPGATGDPSSGEVKLYTNGQRVGTIGYYPFDTLPMTPEPVFLGGKNRAVSPYLYPLHGQLDESAIWTSVISDGDMMNLALGLSTPADISPSTLGGYWQYETPMEPIPPTVDVADTSGNGHTGTMNHNGENPFFPTGGVIDGAVQLNARDTYVDVGDIDGMTEAMTVATWVKPNVLTAGKYQIIASQANDLNPTEWAWQIFLYGDTAQFYVLDNTDGTGGLKVGEATGLVIDQWTHLAMTIASNEGETTGEVRIYKDGVQIGDAFAYDVESLVDSTEPIRFGNKGNVFEPYALDGFLDDTVLFDEALSSDDIADIHEFGVEVFLSGVHPQYPGDANRDGKVDATDARALAENWLRSGIDVTWAMGDFNDDDVVDDLDASILAANWGYGTEGVGVPEPSTLVMLLGALAGFCRLRRR
ncbi:MAG: PEP-CTERM sorting domain-containing protein [Pirellulales bacterium]|nr:PEP-CTERM sorting domain-containing protein [Pirellulales bacterium]